MTMTLMDGTTVTVGRLCRARIAGRWRLVRVLKIDRDRERAEIQWGTDRLVVPSHRLRG